MRKAARSGSRFPVQAQDERYHPKEPVLGVEVDGEFKAYPVVELGKTTGEVHDTLSGRGIVVTYDRRNLRQPPPS